MGTIGVRCANPRTSLWIHLDVKIAVDHLHPDFRNDGRDDAMNRLLRQGAPWSGLTEVGERIIRRVLWIPVRPELGAARAILGVSVAPVYFNLDVKNERAWRRVLPQVVKIIREETYDPGATVKLCGDGGNKAGQWHAPLLRELFG